MMARRIEEVKEGKTELSNLLMSDETLNNVQSLKTEKKVTFTTSQQQHKLTRADMLKWIKQKGLASPEHPKETTNAAIDEEQVAREIFE